MDNCLTKLFCGRPILLAVKPEKYYEHISKTSPKKNLMQKTNCQIVNIRIPLTKSQQCN